jgi:hypothetical protein
MTLRSTAQSIVPAGITPAALTPAASDTFAAACFGQQGMVMRVITTGTATNVTVLDPGFTRSLSNAGTPTAVVCAATGVTELLVANGAISPSTQLATVTFSGALTGVTYEIKKY